MSMRKIIAILLIAAFPAVGSASTSPAGDGRGRAVCLDSCISYALAHSNDLRRGRIEAAQSRYEAKASALDFLPAVEAQVSGQYAWGRNIDPETNTYNTITTFNNYYTVEGSMAVFDGGRTLNAFKRARNARAQAATALQKAADDKAIAVMTKFVDAIYNQQSVALAEEKLADSRALLHKTQRLYELGEKSRPDVAQMESQVAEDDYNLLHQRNQARLTLMALKAEMNWPAEDSLALSPCPAPAPNADVPDCHGKQANAPTPTSGKGVTDIPVASPFGGGAAVELASQKAADLKYAYKIARGRLLPTLTLGGGVQTSYYRNLSLGSGSADAFGRQFHNNLGEYVYLSLSIPLFVPSRWRSARRARADWQKALLDLDDARRKWHDDYAQAVADRDGYSKEVERMSRKVEADSLACHLSVRKYEEGMLSTFDLHTASQTLLLSRIRLLQTQLLYMMKERLAGYYEGKRLWTYR